MYCTIQFNHSLSLYSLKQSCGGKKKKRHCYPNYTEEDDQTQRSGVVQPIVEKPRLEPHVSGSRLPSLFQNPY